MIGGKVGINLSTCVYTKSVLSFEMIFVFEPWERLRIDPKVSFTILGHLVHQ